MKKFKKGFTLAETLITLTILGIVAAITIPSLIGRQQEAANRTKIKKAMTMYEKALNNMIIENDLKTNQAIIDFGAEGGACANTTAYFKKVEGDGCRFKTADRIWWDISDIENPLIILNDKKKDETVANLQTLAKDTSDITTYGMVGRLDDTAGVFRINDNAFEQANGTADQKAYMTKLWNFMNNITSSNNSNSLTCTDDCKNLLSLIKNSGASVPEVKMCTTETVDCVLLDCQSWVYDEGETCNNEMKENYGRYVMYDSSGSEIGYYELATNSNGEKYKSEESIKNPNGSQTTRTWAYSNSGELYQSYDSITNSDGTYEANGWRENTVTGEIFKSQESSKDADGTIKNKEWKQNRTKGNGDVYISNNYIKNPDGSYTQEQYDEAKKSGEVFKWVEKNYNADGSGTWNIQYSNFNGLVYKAMERVDNADGSMTEYSWYAMGSQNPKPTWVKIKNADGTYCRCDDSNGHTCSGVTIVNCD